jgi:archaellum component FlaF (FlaF/FlaG flagellin family)
MSFQYLTFPELRLKHGIEKSINDPVSITSNGNREIRRRVNAVERYSWTIPARHLVQSDMNTIVDFFSTVTSSVDSFLYRDPTMPEAVNLLLKPFTVGGVVYFAMYHSGYHPIMNLGSGFINPIWDASMTNVVVKKNGVALASNQFTVKMNCDPVADLGSTTFQHPRTTVIKDASGTWLDTDIITYSGPLFKTVRFDSMIAYKIAVLEKSNLITGACEVVPTVSQMADIKLMEVFEYKDHN